MNVAWGSHSKLQYCYRIKLCVPVLIAVVDGIHRHSAELFAIADQHLRYKDVFLATAEAQHSHYWVNLHPKHLRQLQ